MSLNIDYAYPDVEQFTLDLPPSLAAKYFRLAEALSDPAISLQIRVEDTVREWFAVLQT